MTELEKMKNGMWYDANYDAEITKKRYHCFDLCFELNQIKPSDMEKKNKIIQKLIGYLPQGLEIVTPFSCDYGKNIHLGKNVFINYAKWERMLGKCSISVEKNWMAQN